MHLVLFLFQPSDSQIYITGISLYIMYTPTCLDISMSSSGNNKQSRNTRIAASKYRLNQEVRFLYSGTQKLNEHVYKIQLECAY
jgi:hypothetical protein